MTAAPLAIMPPPPKPKRPPFKAPKPGCWCSKCGKLRRRAEPGSSQPLDRADYEALIALYEERLATFRRELAEVTG